MFQLDIAVPFDAWNSKVMIQLSALSWWWAKVQEARLNLWRFALVRWSENFVRIHEFPLAPHFGLAEVVFWLWLMAEVLLDYAWLVALLELKGQVLFSNLCNLVVTAHSQLQQGQQDVQIGQWTASVFVLVGITEQVPDVQISWRDDDRRQPYTIPDADGETVLHLRIIQCSCIRCCSVANCFSIVNNFVAAIVTTQYMSWRLVVTVSSCFIRVHSNDIFFIYLAITVSFLPCNWLSVRLRTKHTYK